MSVSILFIILILAALTILSCYIVVEVYAWRRVFEDPDGIPENEFGLVLGTCPTRPDGQPNRYFERRMDAVEALFRKGKVHQIILSGDKHDGYDEPAVMRSALEKRGIPPEKCLLDGQGFDTIDSILNARNHFHASTYTIVSQDFHCERAVFLAGCLGIRAIAFAAKDVETTPFAKTKVREIPARVKVFLDILRHYLLKK